MGIFGINVLISMVVLTTVAGKVSQINATFSLFSLLTSCLPHCLLHVNLIVLYETAPTLLLDTVSELT